MKAVGQAVRAVYAIFKVPVFPRCGKLSLELFFFSVASLVSVFSIFMAALIKHQYKRASRGELRGCWGAAVSGFSQLFR